MNRNKRSIQIGASVLDRKITPDGRDWIIAALDPFHDFQRQLAGYPDADSVHTTVACFQHEIDIAAPAGIAGTWDAHIFNLPFTNVAAAWDVVSSNTDLQFLEGGSGNTLHNWGPLTVVAVDSGQSLFPTTAHFGPTHLEMNSIDATTTAGAGTSRVIAWGYEVVNTTADLTKQGALTVYRMPQTAQSDQSVVPSHTTPANCWGTMSMNRFRCLPSTPAQAMLLGGTRQWAAADGAYVVVPQSSVANPFVSSTNVPFMFSVNVPAATGDHCLMSSVNEVTAPNVQPIPTALMGVPQKYVPFNSTGVMMSGLSPTSTFRIKMKMYVERAPHFNDVTIAPLATPSAPYDATVLKLYSAALSQLPVAVPVSMNAFGDWFADVLSVIADVAGPIGSMVGGAPGSLIGAAASGLARTVSSAVRPKKSDSKPKPETVAANNRREVEKTQRNTPDAAKPVYRVRIKNQQKPRARSAK